jgi:BRCT domain type II-containing protein
MDGGTVAVAIAAAGLRTEAGQTVRAISVPIAGVVNDVARQTARTLADKLGADIAESPTDPVDLIVVGSQPGASSGHIVVGGDVRTELARARSSVLVLPAEVPLLP